MRETVFRVVAALGLVLLLAGSAIYPVGVTRDVTALWLSGAGVALLIVSALANVKSIIAFFGERRGRQGANAVFVTLLFTGMLVIVQAISMRNIYRHDLTRNKRFTLSKQTTSLLAQLDGEIVLTAFLRKHSNSWMRAQALLGMYADAGRDVRYELIDPEEKPLVAERFRGKSGQVVVEYNDNRRKAEEVTEESITNALLFASRERQKVVYFVTGHDEKRLGGGEGTGLRTARQALENTGFITRELSLVASDSIPGDCAVLVLAGPKKEYLQSEVNLIDDFLARGGRALFLLDPLWPISRLKTVLGRYHIEALDYILLDEVVVVDAGDEVFDATYTKIRSYGSHPITRGFQSITIFPVARPLSIVPNEGDNSVDAQYLAVTGKSSWGETDVTSFRQGSATRDDLDIEPPLAVAAVSERTDRHHRPGGAGSAHEVTSRVVVVGDSDFATNRFYGLLGNSDFFLNSVEYLAEDEVVVSIRPKKGLGDRVFITASEGRLIFVLCLVLLPVMVASMGGYVLMRKRRT